MNLKHFFSLLAFLIVTTLPLSAEAGFFDQKADGFGSASVDGFLPVEQAFQLEGNLKGTKLTLTWRIEPKHYLYRSRFKVLPVLPESADLTILEIPRGEQVVDEFQGNVEILRHKAVLSYQFNMPAEAVRQGVVIEVTFQGCAEAGLCYPPHTQQLNLVQNAL
ncbi:protein-disulfide reductase DsbD domain-containing protein [Oceanospirillum sp.]|uniref:protein-disulfide reductase DsbD domain-containing protein n=1 Tax=Oceanospirillum sp. TaxID=2021254 RepID=UPI003A946589